MGDLIHIDVREGVPVVSSRDVAERFGKEHKNVLQAIERLECSEEFRRLNFQPSSYRNEQNREQPMYWLTRDGFTFLAMGFTGEKAAHWKEKYIAAFNAMEERLRQQCQVANDVSREIQVALTSHIIPLLQKYDNFNEYAMTRVNDHDGKIFDHEKRLKELEAAREKRTQREWVKRLHLEVVKHKYAGRCPCCMRSMKEPELDHYSSREWWQPQDTWVVCKECNQGFKNGKLTRSQMRPRFDAYQQHRADYQGGEQLGLWKTAK